jgi:hypothetical protein
VQHHLIDRLDAQAAALYLFLVTVADAQGLSYYGGATLAQPPASTSRAVSGSDILYVELNPGVSVRGGWRFHQLRRTVIIPR